MLASSAEFTHGNGGLNESLVYGTEVDRVLYKRTDNLKEDVRAYLFALI
jgi:hypothetical protein